MFRLPAGFQQPWLESRGATPLLWDSWLLPASTSLAKCALMSADVSAFYKC